MYRILRAAVVMPLASMMSLTACAALIAMAECGGRRMPLFRVLTGLNTMVDSKVGSAGEAVETVVGDWDQVAPTVTGDRMFLKGDRLLQVSYRMSTNDQAGVMHLASIAVKRLAAAP